MSIPSSLSKKSTNILISLVSSYGVELLDFNAEFCLKLEQNGYNRLVFERNEPQVLSLTHYYKQNGDLMADPDVTFFADLQDNQLLLFPLSYTQSNLGIYQEVAEITSERDNLKSFKPRHMKDLAHFSAQWAYNIKAQKWFLENSQPNPLVSFSAR